MTARIATVVLATATYIAAMTVLAFIVLGAMLAVGASLVTSWRKSRAAASSLRVALTGNGDDVALLAAIRETPISVLASDDFLRRGVNEVLTRFATPRDSGTRHAGRGRASVPEISGQLAFDNIDEILANVPPTIPEDALNPPQKACMESLAETLAPMREPFHTWSDLFKRAAEELRSVVPMSEKLGELLSMPLQAKAHFDVDFHEQVNEVRAGANGRDDVACGEAIERLSGSVVEWVHLTRDWYSLRQDAAEHIVPWSSSDEPWHGWLAHVAVTFKAPATGEPMVWWQSALLARADSLGRLSAWIVREIDDRRKDGPWQAMDFSAVCSMSSTGVPLAAMLSAHYRKRLLVADGGAEFHFPPAVEPKAGDVVLLVDSNLSTGHHLERCARRIIDAGATVMGAVYICEDDLSDKLRSPFVDALRRENGLIWLFKLSDIYELWRKEKAALR